MNAAIAAMKKRKDVTTEGMIAVGQSSGGFATIALAARPPKGMVAAISFAGGLRLRRDDPCNEPQLVDAFRTLGRSSRIPTLWIYSENDQLFSPEAAQKFQSPFVAAGGRAEFFGAPKYGTDGHSFFAFAIPQWTPVVDKFLASAGISRPLLPPPSPISLEPPRDVIASGRAAFQSYLKSGPHRAFALSKTGGWAWYWGSRNQEDARKAALGRCEQDLPGAGSKVCAIYAVDDKLEVPEKQ
jgi:hypothetical protein